MNGFQYKHFKVDSIKVKNKFYYFITILILVLFCVQAKPSGPSEIIEDVHLVLPEGISGNNQVQAAKCLLDKPLRILVLGQDNKFLNKFPVAFEILKTPENSNGQKLENTIVWTDANGLAQNNFRLGDVEGDYLIVARVLGNNERNFVVFTVHARSSNWALMVIVGLIGGLALFLLGINLMGTGMQRSAGNRMRSILSNLTHNKIMAVGVGAFVSTIIQSSSATTVMLVSFVNSKLMKFKQTIPIILGAAIGSSITAQIIAFKLSDYALLILCLGFFLQLLVKQQQIKHIGGVILGFGILFYGMAVMSASISPLRTYNPFLEFIAGLQNPFYGMFVGLLCTALIQSSAAFIGIIIIMATQGLLNLESAIALMLGANLGTAVTAILSGVESGKEAKKVALAHTLIKIIGVLILVWWIPQFANLVRTTFPVKGTGGANISSALPQQIANAFMLFNIGIAAIILPFTQFIANLIDKLVPVNNEIPENYETKVKYLDENLISTPALALNLAKQETLRMGETVYTMVKNIIIPFVEKDKSVMEQFVNQEKKVNFLRDEINKYLIKISNESIKAERVNEAFQIMYTIKELEQIADKVYINLFDKASSWLSVDNEFSEEGKKELIEYHKLTMQQLEQALEVFKELNLEKAREINIKYKKYKLIAVELEKNHFERLKQHVDKSILSSNTHLELMDILKEISSHAANIARILIQWSEDKGGKLKADVRKSII